MSAYRTLPFLSLNPTRSLRGKWTHVVVLRITCG